MNKKMGMAEVFNEVVKELETCIKEKYHGSVSINVKDVKKNNNMHRYAVIVESKNLSYAPVIYADIIYSKYLNGSSIDKICSWIFDIYEESMKQIPKNIETMGNIKDFENFKNRICMKLVNAGKNDLNSLPHKLWQDLAITYYIYLDNIEDSSTVKVDNALMDLWGTNADELHQLALKNTQNLMRGEVRGLLSMILNFDSKADKKEMEKPYDITTEKTIAYVASNQQKVFGAAVILYEGLLEDVAKLIGEDFYILPSSVHEVIFINNTECGSSEYLKNMVCDVNSTEVCEDEFLSDNVYHYVSGKGVEIA